MTGLMKILGWGFVAFMAMALVEEWETFRSLLPEDREATVESPSVDDRAVTDAVQLYLSLMSHLYASGGDPRFSERLPAGAEVVEEIMTDAVYLRHNQRRQELSLLDLEILEVAARGPDRAHVRTREYWVVRTFWVPHRQVADPPRSTILSVEYSLDREAQRWLVKDWNLIEDPGRGTPAALPETP